MNLIRALLLDWGVYAAGMALFAAIACYRANPLRAVNRYFSGYLAIVALWQIVVALARTTHDTRLWGPVAAPIGVFFILAYFLVHDACIRPLVPARLRVRQNTLMWLAITLYVIGAALAFLENLAPGFYPVWLRVLAVLGLGLAVFDLRKQRQAAQGINASELFLLKSGALHLVSVFLVFELNRGPSGSMINTAITLAFLAYVVVMLMSEQVFDAAGTARIAFGYLLRAAVHFVLLLAVVEAYLKLGGSLRSQGPWVIAAFLAALYFPIAVVAEWLVRKTLHPFAPRHEGDARDAAVAVVAEADTEPVIIAGVTALAKAYLRGLGISVEIVDADRLAEREQDKRRWLLEVTPPPWLSPELAVKRIRGIQLQRVLTWFADAQLGGVVHCVGRKASVVMYVGERAGGSKPIAAHELDFLHELASIAATGVDRVRAIDESLRTRMLALAGRAAADFSHSTKNQIAAIQAFVEAVKDGEEAKLTTAHREAVHREVQALALTQTMALDLMRLRPDKIALKNMNVAALLESVVLAYEPVAQQAHARLAILCGHGAQIKARADERLLRQVLLNLIRNAVQAAGGAQTSPFVTLNAYYVAGGVDIDIIDNGPGVPPDIHDRLFTPWVTSKPDGNGLGLAFCSEALRAMGASISYLTPRGAEHAQFRISLPADEGATIDRRAVAAPAHSAV